jgi:hypothetical protein
LKPQSRVETAVAVSVRASKGDPRACLSKY